MEKQLYTALNALMMGDRSSFQSEHLQIMSYENEDSVGRVFRIYGFHFCVDVSCCYESDEENELIYAIRDWSEDQDFQKFDVKSVFDRLIYETIKLRGIEGIEDKSMLVGVVVSGRGYPPSKIIKVSKMYAYTNFGDKIFLKSGYFADGRTGPWKCTAEVQ